MENEEVNEVEDTEIEDLTLTEPIIEEVEPAEIMDGDKDTNPEKVYDSRKNPIDDIDLSSFKFAEEGVDEDTGDLRISVENRTIEPADEEEVEDDESSDSDEDTISEDEEDTEEQ